MNVVKLLELLQKLWKSNPFVRFGIVMSVALFLRNVIYMRLYRKWHKLPNGPNGVPILGVLPYGWLIGTEEYHGSVLPKYGAVVSYPTIMQQVLLINDPEIARQVYSSPDTLNRFEPFLQSVSNTITFLNGEQWAQRRKNIHTNLIATINSRQVTKGSLAFLRNVVFPYLDEHHVIHDTRPVLRPLTFNLVLYACVGKHIESLHDHFFLAFDALAVKFWHNFRRRMFTSFLIGNGKLYNLVFKNLFNLTELGENIRKDMVKLVVDYNAKTHDEHKEEQPQRKCFVDYVRESNSLTEQELFSDITSLLFPSIDTTSNILGFALLLLCKYPRKVQQFIYEKELKPVFGSVDNINLTQQTLNKLPYFRAFIFETMRIFPTTRVSAARYLDNHDAHKEVQPIVIETDDDRTYEVNRNLIVSINSIGIGRNPKHWLKDKDKHRMQSINMKEVHFEFWLDEHGRFQMNKSLTIFALGRRECVGKQVAIRNLYVCLAALMLRYRFSVEKHEQWEIPTLNYALYAPGLADIHIERRGGGGAQQRVPQRIPIGQTNLVLSNAGFDVLNGNYRWHLHARKWCYFKESQSYSMENGVNVDDVYKQLKRLQASNADFRWDEQVKKCWVISTMEGDVIYYAAPHLNDEFIPNDKRDWISVHASLPGPEIYPNLLESSFAPNDDDEPFGNVGECSQSSVESHRRSSATSLSSLQPLMETNIDDDDDDDNEEEQEEQQEEEEQDDSSLSDLN